MKKKKKKIIAFDKIDIYRFILLKLSPLLYEF